MMGSQSNTEKKSKIDQTAVFAQLEESIKYSLNLTDSRQIHKLLKSADKNVYTHNSLPRLKRNQVWINGGQTRNWHETIPTSGKQLIFVESFDNITPWLKVSIQDVLKLASDRNPETFATALFNLLEQLKNNYSAAEMGKMMSATKDENATYYANTYIMRKKHAQELVNFLRTVINRKKRFINKYPNLFSEHLQRLAQFEVKLKKL